MPTPPTSPGPSIYDLPLRDIDGQPATLAPYRGRVLLLVNVASRCGHTPQYAGLESLFQAHRAAGLTVLGFPCNQFGAQEPGTEAEIREFCSTKYAVSFPLFAKLDVKGAAIHPLYAALTGPDSPFPGEIGWNFAKFLVGRDGKILARFAPGVTPGADELARAIVSALAAPVLKVAD